MKGAATGGMEEVELGQLAAQKASSPDVKNFGQHMVDDHSKANDQLKQLAAQKGVTLPAAISNMQKHDVSKLAKLSGAAFDSAYVSMMVKDHKKDVAEFQKESKSAKDSDLKSWASTTLPTLEDHLKMIAGHLLVDAPLEERQEVADRPVSRGGFAGPPPILLTLRYNPPP